MSSKIFDFVNSYIESRLGKLLKGDIKYLINGTSFPTNPITKNEYKGINLLLLLLECSLQNFTSNKWATFKQISKHGGQIKKGSKSTKIVFYSKLYFFKGKKIAEETYKNLLKSLGNKKNDLLSESAVLKFYSVFNFNQISEEDNFLNSVIGSNENVEILPSCDSFVKKTTADIIHTLSDVPFYSISNNSITMPRMNDFVSTDRYYSVLFHELAHWGLRNKEIDYNCGKGKKGYAFEELIAELTSSYLSVYFNLKDQRETNAKYINSWMKSLKDDKKYFFKAAHISQKLFSSLIDQE